MSHCKEWLIKRWNREISHNSAPFAQPGTSVNHKNASQPIRWQKMVELFADRFEITNPGEPLVTTDRFVDPPPRSRNETLASHAANGNLRGTRKRHRQGHLADRGIPAARGALRGAIGVDTRRALCTQATHGDGPQRTPARMLPARLLAVRTAPADDQFFAARSFRN